MSRKNYKKLRNDQTELEKAIREIEQQTGKSRQEMIGDVSLAGEGILGALFDLLGWNDGIKGYHDK